MVQEVIVKQGNPVFVFQEEVSFINKVLESKGISKGCFDYKQNILNLGAQYVGFIKTPKRIIQFTPKQDEVTLSHIMRIYYFVHGTFKNFNDDIFSIKESSQYISIADVFLSELEKIMIKGLPTNYIAVQESSKYICGKVDYVKSYKNHLLKLNEPFHCSYDTLSLNTPLNRTLKEAFNKIKKVKTSKKSIVSLLNRKFDVVNGLYQPGDKERVIIDSKTLYCKNAYFFAKLILEESYFDGVGQTGGECLLIDINDLFEKFIKKVLFEFTSDHKFISWNNSQSYAMYGNTEKRYCPDILYNYVDKHDTADVIIDVKNKFGSIYKSADVYQMLFYSSMLKSKKIVLCYPNISDRDVEMLELYSEAFNTNKIHAVFLNICGESKEEFQQAITKFIDDMYLCIES